MSASTVYLFVRTPPDGPTSPVALRRLKALQELRDELRRTGGIVVAAPQAADLHVEITNVFASDTSAHIGADGRVLVVRLAAGEERLDFVCADGYGRATAEQQAARRIYLWLDNLDRPAHPHPPRVSHAFPVTSSNC